MQLAFDQSILQHAARLRLDEHRVIGKCSDVGPLGVAQQKVIALEQNDIVLNAHGVGDHVMDIAIVDREVGSVAAHRPQLLLHEIGVKGFGGAFDETHGDGRAVAHGKVGIEIRVGEVEAVHAHRANGLELVTFARELLEEHRQSGFAGAGRRGKVADDLAVKVETHVRKVFEERHEEVLDGVLIVADGVFEAADVELVIDPNFVRHLITSLSLFAIDYRTVQSTSQIRHSILQLIRILDIVNLAQSNFAVFDVKDRISFGVSICSAHRIDKFKDVSIIPVRQNSAPN